MSSYSCFKVQRAHNVDIKAAVVPRGSRPGGASKDRRSLSAAARANGSDSNGSGGILEFLKSNPLDAIKEGTINLRVGGGIQNNKQGKKQSSFKGKDPMTVFVAGSSGRLGIRVVYELAAAGYKVRAGVRSQDKADAFDDELDDLCSRIGDLDRRARSQINLVYCDLQDEESITPAIGNASRVVCAVGAAESEFTNLAAPKLIDYQATETLINIAASCNISQFILVTSLGTGKIGFPAGVLNLFGGILIWKRKAEEALEQSGMPYLIVRPGGMERPKDDHKEKYNVRLSTRDTLFGGTVSRLQIAELITAAVIDPEVATNKCVEVVAEIEAPLKEYGSLLDFMPVEVDQNAREEAIVTYGDLLAQERQVNNSIESLRNELAETRETIAGLQVALKDARDELKETLKDNSQIIREAEKVEFEVSALRDDAEQKKLLALAAKAVAQAQQRGLSSGTVLTSEDINSIRESILNPPVEEQEEATLSQMVQRQPFFARKPAPVKEEVVEEENEPAETIESNDNMMAKKETGMFGSLIGFLEGDGRRIGSQPEQEVPSAPPADEILVDDTSTTEPEVTVKQENDIFGSLKSLFGGQEAVFIDDLEKPNNVVEQESTPVVVEEEQPVVAEEPTVDEELDQKEKSMFPDIGSFIKPISFPEAAAVKSTFGILDSTEDIQNETDDLEPNARDAREWIRSWRDRTLASSASNEEDLRESLDVSDNVVEVRNWIAAWKARTSA